MKKILFFFYFLLIVIVLPIAYGITVNDPNNNIIAFFNNDTSKTSLLVRVGSEIQVYGKITESGNPTQFNRLVTLYTTDYGNDVEIASKNATNGLVIFNLTITPEDVVEGKLFLKMKAELDTDGNLSTTDDRVLKESNLVKLVVTRSISDILRDWMPVIITIAALALIYSFIKRVFGL